MYLLLRLFIPLLFLLFPFHLFAQGWTKLATTNDPPARRNSAAIYTPTDNRIIIFGGASSSGNLNDLWSLNLTTRMWEQIIPSSSNSPAPRFTHNAVFDSAKNRMIVWSGQGNGLYNDVWAFDFSSRTWQQLWANGNVLGAPLIRYGTAATFDPENRRLINFAGFTSSGRFEDTWYFTVDNPAWTDQTNNPNPMLRCLHAGCFVPDRRLMIVYGGQRSGTLDDIWSLNVDSFIWTNLTPTVRPGGRWFSSVAYDGKGNVIMFGGQTSSATSDELWRFSLATNLWEQIQTGAQQPVARYGHIALFIPQRNSMIVFGGFGTEYLDDTWEFKFSSATDVERQSIPRMFRLEQNFPNPFNPTTTFAFQVAEPSFVSLKIFDALGREVATVVGEHLMPGQYTIPWDASAFPSGVYLYRLHANGFVETKKTILSK
jgi:hypothetical protein